MPHREIMPALLGPAAEKECQLALREERATAKAAEF